jgi:hypothetical protein
VMRRRLMKTHQSMKHKCVSAFSRVYWYLRMRRLVNNSSIHSNWTENADCTNVFSFILHCFRLNFLPVMAEVSHLVASIVHLVSN